MDKKARRARTIIELLKSAYPQAKIALRYNNPWELLVAVVLSAQCTDTMVNTVTEKLFTKYTTVEDYAKAEREEFEKDIRSTGFYRNKARHIIESAKLVEDLFVGRVPSTMSELLMLPGVARKTANIIISNAFGKTEGIAVDTHVLRVCQRLQIIDLAAIGGKKERVFIRGQKQMLDFKKDANADKVEVQLMQIIPKADWPRFPYLAIEHGRAVCKAVRPQCERCILSTLCPVAR
ncbi:endonuclease III [Patescibacteria group bacterium]|nr:endonuclease III [Patescibacteria group bacterium]MBU1472855.1 endonuclease III [Patescibacteria group bacterium]MBU2459512.1 endonuclease III [Patescibacteria group bacterium]MBU2543961.1 endonuclease III [Patescibacteria group bacterium]